MVKLFLTVCVLFTNGNFKSFIHVIFCKIFCEKIISFIKRCMLGNEEISLWFWSVTANLSTQLQAFMKQDQHVKVKRNHFLKVLEIATGSYLRQSLFEMKTSEQSLLNDSSWMSRFSRGQISMTHFPLIILLFLCTRRKSSIAAREESKSSRWSPAGGREPLAQRCQSIPRAPTLRRPAMMV